MEKHTQQDLVDKLTEENNRLRSENKILRFIVDTEHYDNGQHFNSTETDIIFRQAFWGEDTKSNRDVFNLWRAEL